ncbi:MAG: EBNA-1 nuclear protein [Sneathiella sp.]|nr:MAG: EBNA-1 nuclear protein [Sneathiella sp.]
MSSIIHLEQPQPSGRENQHALIKGSGSTVTFPPRNIPRSNNTAIVYCEGNFGAIDGKTANGLVRHSEKYEILSVIDSKKAGLDAGVALGDEPNGIPICRDLTEALAFAKALPGYFIFGMAPASGMLSTYERGLVIEAMNHGMNIVNGLHEFLNDDPVFAAACLSNNVSILDIRKPRDKKDLRMFSGRIAEVTCPRIAVLGTDCAIGKRTTATILTRALNEYGVKAVMIGTGQTGIIQGARYGIALDAIPSQFCSGELEATIVEAFEAESPDIIIVEGQGALSHPAFSTSSFILRGTCPDGVVLQHAPGRINRCDFDQMPMPTPASEVNLIETFSDTKVIGLTINHENMTDDDVDMAINSYEKELGIPVTDALTRSPDHLVEMVLVSFPQLRKKSVGTLN